MRYFRKYEFTNQAAADACIAALPHDEEGNPTHSHSIVRIGHIVTTPAAYDDEGNELTPAEFTTTYHVDVLWNGEIDTSWDDNMIWCAGTGVHMFGSSSAIAEYLTTCKALHPEFFPEPNEEEL